MLGQLTRELATLRLGDGDAMSALIPELARYIDVENLALYAPRSRDMGMGMERWHAFGLSDQFARDTVQFLSSDRAPVWFDVMRPLPSHRDKLVEATAWIERTEHGAFERTAMYRELLEPARMNRHLHHRVLLCEGPILLAWFGTLHVGPLAPRQSTRLRALVGPLRRRLALERRLARGSGTALALDALLESLGSAAMVLDAAGRVQEANAAARVQLSEQRTEVFAAIRDATQGRPSTFDVTPLREHGRDVGWLARHRAESHEARIAARVATTTAQLRLTVRQARVLELLVLGQANASIAGTLGIGERAVELHVTALLDRFQVENRAALVAAVLVR